MTQTKRKGARWLDIGDQRWSYYRGKKFVEIRSPDNKATLVSRDVVSESVGTYCECCREPDGGTVEITLPRNIAHYIRANLL